jgi:hypothetical protein
MTNRGMPEKSQVSSTSVNCNAQESAWTITGLLKLHQPLKLQGALFAGSLAVIGKGIAELWSPALAAPEQSGI